MVQCIVVCKDCALVLRGGVGAFPVLASKKTVLEVDERSGGHHEINHMRSGCVMQELARAGARGHNRCT